MKCWLNVEAMIAYFTTEGFIVGDMKCLECGLEIMAILPPEADQTQLECRRCGAKHSRLEVVNPL